MKPISFMESFEAHWGAPGGVFQTIVGSQLRGKSLLSPPRIRHELHLNDQGRAIIYEIEPQNETLPIVLLAHGMGGCSESVYMKRISNKLWMRGYGVILINQSGCGPGMGLSPRMWHGGSSDDLEKMIDFVVQRYPERSLAPVGFSLSGNVLLKYLGEERKIPENISGALAVNPPVDLRVASDIISRKWSCALFNKYYMRLIRNQAVALVEQFPSALNPLKNLKTIWDFDVNYTAPAGGFKDVDDYYDRSSSKHFLEEIKTPTSILSAKDDPFVPGYLFDQIAMNEKVTLHKPDNGGHMGYISRRATPHGDRRWMDYAVLEWIRELHESEGNP